ncbi:T9SS sorting signal type C domain-containing protein [Flavobacterium notoginsengisoli]|uniref:T9SS sorting signal type C domain-containing protein n=1 Tax=Flavobacterium notoginsengisoli TaxID=1478199 RepID=UPI0036339F2D
MMRKLLYSFLFFISNSSKKTFKPSLGLLCVGMFFVVSYANAATITSTATGGNWNVPSTWSGGIVPLPTDIVVIANLANVLTNGNQTCAGITITGRLTMMDGETLTVNGNVSGGGNWTTGGGIRTISLTGNWSFNGTSTGSGATAVFTGTNTQSLTGRITTSGGELVVNKTGGSLILGNTLSIGTFTNTTGIFDAATYLLTTSSYNLVAGTLRVGATTWGGNYSFVPTSFPIGFTVEYDAAGQTVRNLNYANLTLSGSGTKTLSGATTINGNLNILNGVTFSTSTSNYAINLGGDFTNNGAFTAGSSTVTFDGANDAIIQGSSTTSFNNLVINKNAKTTKVTNNNTAFRVLGNLTVTQGNLVLTASDSDYDLSNDLIVSVNGILSHYVGWGTNKRMNVWGSIAIDGLYDYGSYTPLVNMYTAGETVRSGPAPSAFSFLTLAHSSGIIRASGLVTVNANFWAPWNVIGGAGVFETNGNTVIANSTLFVAGGRVRVNGGTLTVKGGLNVGAVTTAGVLEISSGTLDADDVYVGAGTIATVGTITHTGGTANIKNLTINATGTNSYACPSGTPTINISENWTNNKVFTAGSSTVNFTGTGTQTINGILSGNSGKFYNLVFNGINGNWTNNATIEVSNALTMTNGFLSTTTTSFVNVTNSSTSAISGGSSNSFVKGPIRWSSSTASTYLFPTGKGTLYLPFTLINNTAPTSSPTAQAEAFLGDCGGTADNTVLASLSKTEYWSLVTSGNFTNTRVSLSRPTTISPLDAVGGSTTLSGTYTSLAGTVGVNGVTNSSAIGNNRFFVLARIRDIVITSITSPFCAGTTFPISYSLRGPLPPYASGNIFTAQLSDATGSFSSPTTIGSVTSSTPGSISVTIPNGTAAGTGYKMRIVSSNPVITGSEYVNDLTIRPIFNAGAISSTGETICYGGTPAAIGSTTAASGGDGNITYQWQSSTDAAFISPTTISNNTVGYTPPAGLTANMWYRRQAKDGACSGFTSSTNVWAVTVRAQFTAGAISSAGETICYGGTPAAIGSTTAASGGDGNITYQWQSSTDAAFTSPTTISNNTVGYTPPAGLTANMWYRRQAKDGACSGFTSSTNVWAVTVRAQFTAGAISSTGETICYGGTPAAIGSTTAASGGDGNITYQWQSSTDAAFTSPTTISTNNISYTPPAGLTANMWYRRQAKDGACSGFTSSTNVWAVTVRAQFTAGAISSAGETICYGGTPAAIGSTTAASGGDGNITYQWQSSTDAAFTSPTIISNNTVGYTPPAGLTANMWYRRQAKDGTCSGFTSSTNVWAVTVRAQFTAGAISSTGETICYGGTPAAIGSTTTASGGDGNIIYQWQSSTDAAFTSPTTISTNNISYTPPAGLTVNMWYRRQAKDGACSGFTSSANVWAVTVRAQFTAGAISSTGETICYGGTPAAIGSTTVASGGDGNITYQWQSSTDASFTSPTTISNNTVGYTPPAGLTANMWYRRQAKDGACSGFTSSTNVWAVTVRAQFTAGAISSTGETICYGGTPAAIGSTTAASGGDGNITYQWQANGVNITSTNNATYTPPVGLTTTTTYTRFANDGTCNTATISNGSWTITVNPIENTPSIGTITHVTCLGQGKVILGNLPSGSFQINQTGDASRPIYVTGSTGTYEVTGLAAGKYYFTVQTTTTCASGLSAEVEIKDESSTTWNGSGWSNGLPNETKSVIITSAAGDPLAADIEACSLIISVPNDDSDPFVTVPEGVTLTITNAVTSNGKLLFESGASLIQKTDIQNSGEIVYQRTTSVRRYDLTYWSMPVTKEGFTMYNLSPATLVDKYFYFDPVKGDWAINGKGTMKMKTGQGYSIRAPQNFSITDKADFTANFTGIPNNGDIPADVVEGKWNLIGNPYPSAISAKQLLDDNEDLGTLYFWAHTNLPVKSTTDQYIYYTDDFVAYNGLGGIGFNGYIAAAQGFLIKAPAATTTVKFNNNQRRLGNNKQFFKTAASETDRHRIWLNMTNATGAIKQILVGYIQGATNTTDAKYDGLSMASSGVIDFYSINNSKKLMIQGRAMPFSKSDLVPFGYTVTAKGDYTVSIDHADGMFNENQEVYLEDKTTGKITNLRLADYKFTSEKGTFNSRLVLRYTNSTLGTDDFESLENSVLISVKDKVVRITSSKETIKDVNIFNIGAQLLYNKNNVNSSELQISNLQCSDQALLVKISLENGHTFTRKIIYSNL